MSRVVVPESQPWENDSDYENVGAKIMERSKRDDVQWYVTNRAPGSWMHQTSKK